MASGASHTGPGMTAAVSAKPPEGGGPQLIGVDLGGTAIKLGRFDAAGTLLAELEVATPRPSVPGAVSIAIAEAIARLDPEGLAGRVGIGLPGPTDAAGRVARLAINLEGWEEVPLADWLEPQVERSVTLANDANCAMVGEAWQGAARGCANALLLTLGTGVGGGIWLDGTLYTGPRGAAGELGLISVDPEGPPCRSGNRGSLEQHCSIGGLARLSPLDPRDLCRRAEAGEAEALATFGPMMVDKVLADAPRLRWVQALGTGVDNLADLPSFRPGTILTNLHGIHGESMSEATLMLMLSLPLPPPLLLPMVAGLVGCR